MVRKEESNSSDTKLLPFKSADKFIEISYQNKEPKKQTQIFEMLSDSLLRDETGREYQWFEDEVK